MTHSGARRALLAALLLGLVAALPGPPSAGAAQVAVDRPRPLLWSGAVGDPSVVRVGDRRVVVATGPDVTRAYKDPGRGWRWTGQALARRPAWARARGDIWAADLARIGTRWVMYYSVPVAGLGRHGRCIGVAVARRALDAFRPVGTRPLVCPARADTPRAADAIHAPGLPRTGAIDPSYFTQGGRRYLLYKTDGVPSSIRLLPLSSGGLHVRRSADPDRPSRELVRSDGVIENPVLLRRDADYYLFTSEGDFARCSYRQMWRRSTSLTAWDGVPGGYLLTRHRTGGLCGPAGGDVLVDGSSTTIYFHGWVRTGTTTPPGRSFWAWEGKTDAIRALYAARLRFPGKVPTVARYLG
ncbi:family 43 glycosylhydrolase [Nocardioides sp. SYSU DS0651]|uniref:family 43 glycosylhydrolase n=1 Tax=Nocardioides sp. SYSU DS0651 TaxID=3415955 RepID=UPI003F4B3636